MANSRQSFDSSPFLSYKHSSYFETYDHLFRSYVGKPLTFVEIGVLNGGSLFMWRDFFGPQARIIGIDLNPDAERWREHGFEIVIGDQANVDFWKRTCEQLGPVDIVLDDGGHTFHQQIVTVEGCLPMVRDGGMIVVEDTHTSYMREFGGPSRRSFVSYAKNVVDGVNYRSSEVARSARAQRVIAGVSFFESIVALYVDRSLAGKVSHPVSNEGETADASDFRYQQSGLMRALRPLRDRVADKRGRGVAGAFMFWAYRQMQGLVNWRHARSMVRYFRH